MRRCCWQRPTTGRYSCLPHTRTRKDVASLTQRPIAQISALDFCTSASKSFVISLALCRNHIGAEQAVAAARVAEQHQIDEWGEVEAGHDLDAADLAVRISAASTFMRMLRR